MSNPRDDKERIEKTKSGMLQDSYRWVLNTDNFRRWRIDNQSRLSEIKGDPGKGKTMLLHGIIDEMRKESSSTESLSYFFCQATNSRNNTATAVLRGLIYFLVDEHPSLISLGSDMIGPAKSFEDADTWNTLSNIITDITQNSRLENTCLIVDALDECVVQLLELPRLIVQSISFSSRLKWIVSSRNWPNIEEGLGRQEEKATLSLELNAESVSKVVNNYIKHKVDDLAQIKEYNDSTKISVQEYLLSNASGTFLWVALICQNLAYTAKRKFLLTLKTYLSDLKPLYQRILRLVYDSEDSELLKQGPSK